MFNQFQSFLSKSILPLSSSDVHATSQTLNKQNTVAAKQNVPNLPINKSRPLQQISGNYNNNRPTKASVTASETRGRKRLPRDENGNIIRPEGWVKPAKKLKNGFAPEDMDPVDERI